MAQHQRVRRSDAGDRNLQRSDAIVRLRELGTIERPRADQPRPGIDSKISCSRRTVHRVPCGSFQRAEPRESAESQRDPEQPDLRKVRRGCGSANYATGVEVRVLEAGTQEAQK